MCALQSKIVAGPGVRRGHLLSVAAAVPLSSQMSTAPGMATWSSNPQTQRNKTAPANLLIVRISHIGLSYRVVQLRQGAARPRHAGRQRSRPWAVP